MTSHNYFKPQYFLIIIVMIISFIFTIGLWSKNRSEEHQKIFELMNKENLLVTQAIQSKIDNSVAAINRMARRWQYRVKSEQEYWVEDAKQYVHDIKSLKSVEWIDEHFQSRWHQSLDSNNTIIPHDTLLDDRTKDLLNNNSSNQTVIVVPTNISTIKYPTFISYTSIYNQSGFHGLIVGRYDFSSFIDSISRIGFRSELNLQIKNSSGDIIYTNTNMTRSFYSVTDSVSMYGQNWHITTWPKESFLNVNQPSLSSLILLGGSIISILNGIIFYFLLLARQQSSQINEKSRMLHAVIDNAVDGLLTTNRKGIIETFNSTNESIFGYNLREIKGKKIETLIPNHPIKKLKEYMNQNDEAASGIRMEIEGTRKDGTLVPLEAAISEVKVNNRTIFSIIMHDISERKQAEAEIRKHVRHTELILGSANDGICGIDLEGRITFSNPTALKLTGYDLDETVNANLHELIHHSHADGSHYARAKCPIHNTMVSGAQYVTDDEVFWRKDGTSFPVEYTAIPMLGETQNVTGTLIVFRDITARKENESDLLKEKEKAEIASKLKSEFLANMSHEIRTPMNGVIGMSHLLLETDISSKQRSYLENVINSAESLLHIINDILDLSKIEANKLKFEKIPFDLESLSNDVAEIMAIKCGEKNVEMLMRYAPGTPRFVVGDPGRVRQILINLISNAIKFTHSGHVLLYIQSQQTIDNTTLFRVEIQDTGIGIPNDKLDLIFNKFDQADQSTTRQYGGTGLGLAICKRLAEMMNGDIGVYSKLDKGSTFWFTMELEKNLTQLKPRLNKQEINLENVKVLAIDQSDTALDILTEQLKSEGIQTTTTHTARAALEAMNNKSFDIIITEQNISGMNGEELAQKVTKKFRDNVPLLIMLTSTPFKGDGAHLKEIGFNGYITKPTSPDDMYEIISTAYDAHINGLDKGLITRHTIREDKYQNREAIKLNHAEVLLAEDNVINQMVATTMLESIDGVVNIAGNGKEAVNLATQRPYDIIFMDCHMPEIDGYEATQDIRKYEQKNALTRTPIIALTANAMSGDREKCLHSGMDDYISKPIRQDTLEKILQKWIPEKIKYDYSIIHPEQKATDKNEKNTEIVDFTVLNRLQEISSEIIFKLISEADHLIQDTQQSIEKQDSIKLAEAAHALKSFSKLVGAHELAHIALEIEMCGHAQKTGEALIMLDLLLAKYNEVITTLKDYTGSLQQASDSSSKSG